jgi:hypothetical protein
VKRIFLAILVLGFSWGCGENSTAKVESVPDLTYTVYKDETFDKPYNTCIKEHLLANGKFSEQALRELLSNIYEHRNDRHFQYFDGDPEVNVFVYSDEARAQSMDATWVAMMFAGHGEQPQITIDDKLLERLKKGPSVRFRLTEDQREKFYRSVTNCQDSLANPDDQAAQLACRYKGRSAYHLTKDECDKVLLEGLEYKWPLPSPSYKH